MKTVSRVINDEKNVKESTRLRVLKAIEELDYIPNLAAKSMRSGKSNIVLVVSYGVTSTPYGYPMINAIENHLTKHGYKMLIYNVVSDFSSMDKSLQNFYNQYRPEYVIFASFYHREFSLDKDTFPCKTVLLNCYNKRGDLLSYIPDEELAGLEIVKTLISKNYRNIGFLDMALDTPAGILRKKGIERAISEYNQNQANKITLEVLLGDKSVKDLSEIIALEIADYKPSKYLKEQIKTMVSLPKKRDVIICATDSMAMMTYFEIQKQGFRIPEDIGVISFDNFILISRFLDPDLYTMELPHIQMGTLASRAILSSENLVGKIKVPMSLITGNSLRK